MPGYRFGKWALLLLVCLAAAPASAAGPAGKFQRLAEDRSVSPERNAKTVNFPDSNRK